MKQDDVPLIQNAELRAFLMFLRRVLLMLVWWIGRATGQRGTVVLQLERVGEDLVLTERDLGELVKLVSEKLRKEGWRPR